MIALVILHTQIHSRKGHKSMKKRLIIHLTFTALSCLVGLNACAGHNADGQPENSAAPGETQSSSACIPDTQTEASGTLAGSPDAPDTAQKTAAQPADDKYASLFDGITLAKSYKGLDDANPLMTQRFGADPFAMVCGDRVYFYMTADSFEYNVNKEIVENTYGTIRSINVISTADMINFTDHGSIRVAGPTGAAKWAAR